MAAATICVVTMTGDGSRLGGATTRRHAVGVVTATGARTVGGLEVASSSGRFGSVRKHQLL